MKIPFIAVSAVILAGCASPQPKPSLTAQQASALAVTLASNEASAVYHGQPFRSGEPARFVAGHWRWTGQRGYGQGDLQATVELAADGSTNQVVLNLLSNININ